MRSFCKSYYGYGCAYPGGGSVCRVRFAETRH